MSVKIREIKKAGDLLEKAMFSFAEAALKAANAVKRFNDTMNKIEMDKRLRRFPQIRCKYKGRQIRF